MRLCESFFSSLTLGPLLGFALWVIEWLMMVAGVGIPRAMGSCIRFKVGQSAWGEKVTAWRWFGRMFPMAMTRLRGALREGII